MHRQRTIVHSLRHSRTAATATKSNASFTHDTVHRPLNDSQSIAWDASVDTSKWAKKPAQVNKWALPPAANTVPPRPNLEKWSLPSRRTNEPLFRSPAAPQLTRQVPNLQTGSSSSRGDFTSPRQSDTRRDRAPGQMANGSTATPPTRTQTPSTKGKWSRFGNPADETLSKHRPNNRSSTPPKQPQTQVPAFLVAGPSKQRVRASEQPQPGRPEPIVVLEELEDVPVARGDKAKQHRLGRTSHKQRGSLRSHMEEDVAIPSHPRVHSQQHPSKKQKNKVVVEKQVSKDVYIPSTVSVGQLARLLDVSLESLQQKMWESGMGDQLSYDHILTPDYAVLIVGEYGLNPVVNDEAAFDIFPPLAHPNPDTLPLRPPVVTIMGHVDHGKTTLLDTLRSSAVAKGEAGGITQHIGAFSVPVPEASSSSDSPKSITFLDTPGHAAFSAMRARGAGVTDLVVLVVAADDGVMPQTKEVIDLIKQEQGRVGAVVAINKVDKPGIDVKNVQNALLAEDVQLEAFGGDVPSVEVSGLTGQGLPELIETLSALAEMQNLRAEAEGPIHGYVLESKVHKGLGAVATILILRGTLKSGMHLICGLTQAKVRVMNDSSGAVVKTAGPGVAVTVSGWKSLPNAGDDVLSASEGDIKRALANRQRRADLDASLIDAEAINEFRRQERELREKEEAEAATVTNSPGQTIGTTGQAKAGGPKELRLVIKGDVSGSVEAVVGALQGIGNDKAITKIVSSGVGEISESDITMAKTAGAMVVGFSVKAPRSIESLAARNGVAIYSSAIIYQLMDEVKRRVIELLPRVIDKRVTGEATVLQLFDIHVKGKVTRKIAGCRVTNGIVEKAKKARVMRDGQTIYEGNLDTMRLLKKDVIEIRKGSECGLGLVGFEGLREGDLIQMYHEVESLGSL